jgi:hypothetical protein
LIEGARLVAVQVDDPEDLAGCHQRAPMYERTHSRPAALPFLFIRHRR